MPSFDAIADALRPLLPGTLAAAIAAAARGLEAPDWCVLHPTERPLPCAGAVVDRGFVASTRRAGGGDGPLKGALIGLQRGDVGVAGIDLLAVADDEAGAWLRRYRDRSREIVGFPQEQRGEERERRREAFARLLPDAVAAYNASPQGRRLPAILWHEQEAERWRADAEVAAAAAAHDHDLAWWAGTLQSAGWPAVRAIWARLDGGAEEAPPLPATAPESRPELLAAVAASGLGRVAQQVVDTAREAVRVELVPGAAGRSRIGGEVTLLPTGRAWPLLTGEPLTLLAAIDCAELPSAAAASLPADGTLSFFAALSEHALRSHRWPEEGIAVIHCAGGEGRELGAPEPGALAAALPGAARAVRFSRRLTLPDEPFASERLGLTTPEADAYERLLALLAGDRDEAPAQLLGHPAQQPDAFPSEETLLFELVSSAAAGFELLDGGAVLVGIDPAALRAGDWSRARGTLVSG